MLYECSTISLPYRLTAISIAIGDCYRVHHVGIGMATEAKRTVNSVTMPDTVRFGVHLGKMGNAR